MRARLFADLTMALEDMHRHAVDGQARDLSPDTALALLERLRAAVAVLEAILAEIAVQLGGAR